MSTDNDEPEVPQTPEPVREGNGYPIRPTTVVAALIGIPLIYGWIYLSFRIIDSGIANPAVLENIEGLLTALAVLGIPASMIIKEVFDKWRDGGD